LDLPFFSGPSAATQASVGLLRATAFASVGPSVYCTPAGAQTQEAGIESNRTVGERTATDVIRQQPGSDPSAVLFDALQGAGITSSFYLLPGAGHADAHFDELENQKIVSDFFDTYLRGPEKSARRHAAKRG